MKRLTLHRLASALLCLTLALSLTACGGKKKPAPAAGNGGVKETISDSRTDQTGQADPVKPSEPEAEVDQELVEECLDKLGFDLEYGGYPGAAAYLGCREKGDTSKLSDWMLENCLDLTAEMPVMLTIPSERATGTRQAWQRRQRFYRYLNVAALPCSLIPTPPDDEQSPGIFHLQEDFE